MPRPLALGLVLVFVLLRSAAAAPLWETVLEDDFSGTTLNPAVWSWESNGGGSVSLHDGYADIVSGPQDGGGAWIESRDSVDVAACAYRLTVVVRPESPGVDGYNDASHWGLFKWETTHDPDAWYPFTTSSFMFHASSWLRNPLWYAEVSNGQRGEQFQHQLGPTGWETQRRYVIVLGGGTATYSIDGTEVFRGACPRIPSGSFKIRLDRTSPGENRHLYVDYVKLERSTSCVIPRPAVIFASNRGSNGSFDIWVMAPDGSSLRRLTHTPDLDEFWPRVSPDGKWVLAVARDWSLGSRGNGRVFRIRADGSQSQEILTNVANKSGDAAAWSPDGARVLVGVHDGPDDEHHVLYSYALLANGDGGAPMALTNGAKLDQADSPHAFEDLAAFSGGAIGDRTRVLVVNASGDQNPLLDVASGDPTINLISPRWSPGGTRIVCTAEIPGGPNNLRLVDYPAGTWTTVPNAVGERAVFMSEDRLLYASQDGNASHLRTIHLDGTNDAALTLGPASDTTPEFGLLVTGLIGAEEGSHDEIAMPSRPRSLRLGPNPSRDKVDVHFDAHGARDAAISIYDVLGRQVQSIRATDAEGRATWDGRGSDGRRVPAGVYFVRLVAGATRETARVTLLR